MRIISETNRQKKRRYNLHYKLRKRGYVIRLNDRYIIRPEETTPTTTRWENELCKNEAYTISKALL